MSADNRRRVLQDHQQEGKRFIPPFLQNAPITESQWMGDRVPELIWIALLNEVYGVKDGTSLGLSIAKAAAKCVPDSSKAFAALSDYMDLGDDQKECIRSTLREEGILAKAHEGLAALIYNYASFPIAFLAQPVQAQEEYRGTTLNDLKEAIYAIYDREGAGGVFAQSTFLYIYMINGKLSVPAGSLLANLPAIEEYPHTGESRMVAASIRAAVIAMLSWNSQSDWPISFWNQGRLIGSCEVPS